MAITFNDFFISLIDDASLDDILEYHIISLRPVVLIQDDEEQWVDFSSKLENAARFENTPESSARGVHGTNRVVDFGTIRVRNEGILLDSNFVTNVSSIVFDNGDGFFNQPFSAYNADIGENWHLNDPNDPFAEGYDSTLPDWSYLTNLITLDGNASRFTLSRDRKRTNLTGKKVKIAVDYILDTGREIRLPLVVMRAVGFTDVTLSTATLKLEVLSKQYKEVPANTIRDGYGWIRNKPFSYILRRIIRKVEGSLNLAYKIPSNIEIPVSGRIRDPNQLTAQDHRNISSLGRAPNILGAGIDDEDLSNLDAVASHDMIPGPALSWTFCDTAILEAETNNATKLAYTESQYTSVDSPSWEVPGDGAPVAFASIQNLPKVGDSISLRNSDLGNDGNRTIIAIDKTHLHLNKPLSGLAEVFESGTVIVDDYDKDVNPQYMEYDPDEQTENPPQPHWSINRVYIGIDSEVYIYNPIDDTYIDRWFLTEDDSSDRLEYPIRRLWQGARNDTYDTANRVLFGAWEGAPVQGTITNPVVDHDYNQKAVFGALYSNNGTRLSEGNRVDFRDGGDEIDAIFTGEFCFRFGAVDTRFVGQAFRHAENITVPFSQEVKSYNAWFAPENTTGNTQCRLITGSDTGGEIKNVQNVLSKEDIADDLIYKVVPVTAEKGQYKAFTNFLGATALGLDEVDRIPNIRFSLGQEGCVVYQPGYGTLGTLFIWRMDALHPTVNETFAATVEAYQVDLDTGVATKHPALSVNNLLVSREYLIFADTYIARGYLLTNTAYRYDQAEGRPLRWSTLPRIFQPTAGCAEINYDQYFNIIFGEDTWENADGGRIETPDVNKKTDDVVYFSGMGWVEDRIRSTSTAGGFEISERDYSISIIAAIHLNSDRYFFHLDDHIDSIVLWTSAVAGEETYYIQLDAPGQADPNWIRRFKRGQVLKVHDTDSDVTQWMTIEQVDTANLRIYVHVPALTVGIVGANLELWIMLDILYHSFYEDAGAMGNCTVTDLTTSDDLEHHSENDDALDNLYDDSPWIYDPDWDTEDKYLTNKGRGFLSDQASEGSGTAEFNSLFDSHQNAITVLEMIRMPEAQFGYIGSETVAADTSQTLLISAIERKSVTVSNFSYIVGIRGAAYWNAWTSFGNTRVDVAGVSYVRRPTFAIARFALDEGLDHYPSTDEDNYPGLGFGRNGDFLRFDGPIRGFVSSNPFPNYIGHARIRNSDNSAIFAIEGEKGTLLRFARDLSVTDEPAYLTGSELNVLKADGGAPPASGGVYATGHLGYNAWIYTAPTSPNLDLSTAFVGTVFGACGPMFNIYLQEFEDRSGNFVFFKYDFFRFCYAEIFDFTDMDCWKVLELLAQASNHLVGFSSDTFFFVPREVRDVPDYILTVLEDQKNITDIKVNTGETEVINQAVMHPVISKREDNKWNMTLNTIGRTTDSGEPPSISDIKNTNSYSLRARLQALGWGFSFEGLASDFLRAAAIFKYSVEKTQYEVTIRETFYPTTFTGPNTFDGTIKIIESVADLIKGNIIEFSVTVDGALRTARGVLDETPQFPDTLQGIIRLANLISDGTPGTDERYFDWILGDPLSINDAVFQGTLAQMVTGTAGWSDGGRSGRLSFETNAEFDLLTESTFGDNGLNLEQVVSLDAVETTEGGSLFRGWSIVNVAPFDTYAVAGFGNISIAEEISTYDAFFDKRKSAFCMIRQGIDRLDPGTPPYIHFFGTGRMQQKMYVPANTPFVISFEVSVPRGTGCPPVEVYIHNGDTGGADVLYDSINITGGFLKKVYRGVTPANAVDYKGYVTVQIGFEANITGTFYNDSVDLAPLAEGGSTGWALLVRSFKCRLNDTGDVLEQYVLPQNSEFQEIGDYGVFVSFDWDENTVGPFLPGDVIDITAGGIVKEFDSSSIKSAFNVGSISLYGISKKEIKNPFLDKSWATDLAEYLVDLYGEPGSVITITIPFTPLIPMVLNQFDVITNVGVQSAKLFPNDYRNMKIGYIREITHDLKSGTTKLILKELVQSAKVKVRVPIK